MAKAKPKRAVTLLDELMAEASAVLSKGEAFAAMGGGEDRRGTRCGRPPRRGAAGANRAAA